MRYSIDEQEKTITYWHDEDTGAHETASMAEILELLFWLRSRERDLRYMVYNAAPLQVARPMAVNGDYYTGVTEDRRPVKVLKSRFDTVLAEQEALVRRSWVLRKRDALNSKRHTAGAELVIYDRDGREIPAPEMPTEEDTPPYLIQEHIGRVIKPEWWVNNAADNLDFGKYIKLP